MNFCRSGVMVFIHPERVLREAHGVHCGEAPPRSGFVQHSSGIDRAEMGVDHD